MHKSIDIATSNAAPREGVACYTYTYGGHKFLKTTELEGENLETRLYLGGAEFVEGQPESYYHGEGRVALTGSEPRFQYKLTDHLGNTMVLFEDINGDGIITTESMNSNDPVEVLQRNFYYAFGLPMQGPWNHAPADTDMPYLYNGKELEGELGLGWMDYGARRYDAAIGRWGGVDPLAHLYYGWSSYNYVLGNPISFVDPEGRSVILGGNADPNKLIKLISESFNGYVVASIRNGNLAVELAQGISAKDLTGEQNAVFEFLRDMTISNKPYKINVENDRDGHGGIDSYNSGTIWPDNFENYPDEGPGSKLYFLDHVFREQKIKQDRRYVPNPHNNEAYLDDHALTLAQQSDIFGYTQGERRDSQDQNVTDLDFLDSNGKYLRTLRIDSTNGKPDVTPYVKEE